MEATGTGIGPTSTDELSGEGLDGDKVRSVKEVKHDRKASRWGSCLRGQLPSDYD